MAYTFDKFEQYAEDLLNAQYKVSDIIEHKLTRGEIREDFLCDVLRDSFVDPPNLQRGVLYLNGTRIHNQVDIVLCRDASRRAPIRSSRFSIMEPQDLKMILEVKSNATGTDLKKFNDLARKVKTIGLTHPPLCGMFCYNLRMTMDNVFKRFGHKLDNTLLQFVDDITLTTQYSHIDFLVTIDTKPHTSTGLLSQYTLLKDNTTGRYIRSAVYPTIKNLFDIVQQAIRTP